MEVTRFAPSPSGRLHLGHALAALEAWAAAGPGGTFLVRIEDIDTTRCRAGHEAGIFEDLRWLGLAWEEPVRRQSEHLPDYAAALEQLKAIGCVYPCFCTRAEIQREMAAAGQAPHGPDGPLYPGTCRRMAESERAERLASAAQVAWRLDAGEAARQAGPLTWTDERHGVFHADAGMLGDVVLARKDIATSYHVSVVVDDAAQGVTLVTRGEDLLPCTHVHRVLQALLALPVPRWHHHRLVCDAEGRRLAKRDAAAALATLREAGMTAAEVRAQLGFS